MLDMFHVFEKEIPRHTPGIALYIEEVQHAIFYGDDLAYFHTTDVER